MRRLWIGRAACAIVASGVIVQILAVPAAWAESLFGINAQPASPQVLIEIDVGTGAGAVVTPSPACCLASLTRAGDVLYATGQTILYQYDIPTGTWSNLGSLAPSLATFNLLTPFGLAYDAASNTLYGITSTSLLIS